ncbi:3-oxoacyl-ACP synthase III family protein [Parvicella tangerina]|uniref:3-oxoacyl-[acyl-carrier-protein] synthase 3 protein 2 n=1 Tax=Parvicella tangerina TaxID=2829795 RepID=A0A916JKM1_9FLAO|nr:ketoacyl-ACP synthase III [Parvicella tangerina]CAG5079152.1 3-oxoacyl-[acyl-carrier-protein] synthase 3 protein 2 [Parvicella tangerina]
MSKAFIQDIVIHTPTKELTNEELSTIFGIPMGEIFRSTGIKKRFLSAPDELASDLAVEVGKAFFNKSVITKDEVDFLLYVTSALDYVGPATACLIHEQLGLPKTCAAIDIPMGCSGFTNGLLIAKALVENGTGKNVLLITSDMPTKVLHSEDYHLRALFSDAAAATLISDQGGFLVNEVAYGCDGSGAENLIIRGSGARNPVDKEWITKYEKEGGLLIGRMEMDGMEILRFSLREVPTLLNELLEKNNLSKDDIDLFIFHHASDIVIRFLSRKMNISSEKVFTCLEDFGNTVSASIPIAIHEAKKAGVIKANSVIFIAGFGIGYSWSGTILKTE